MKYGFFGLLLLVQVATAYGAEWDMAQVIGSLFRPDPSSNLVCEIKEEGAYVKKLVPNSDKWVKVGSLKAPPSMPAPTWAVLIRWTSPAQLVRKGASLMLEHMNLCHRGFWSFFSEVLYDVYLKG